MPGLEARVTPVRICLLSCLALTGVCGCARMPSAPSQNFPRHRLTVTMVLAAPLSPAYHYFVAVDDTDPGHGPVPLVATPSTPIPPLGVPIIVSDTDLPPRYYCWLNASIFGQYRNSVFIGPPYRGQISADGKTITTILNSDQITDKDRIQLNLITADRLIPPDDPLTPIVYDGLGPTGNNYLSDLSLRVNAIYSNATAAIPEQGGDCPIAALDIVDWTVEVSIE
jgi:hypothetical protein